MELKPGIIDKLQKLEQKFQTIGQDVESYLEGLLHADYLTYWDYIQLDTLLTLQKPKTPFPDEKVFIMYHQITELYFKLILHEIEQISFSTVPSVENFQLRMKRINRYWDNLIQSYEVMVEGMDPQQFLKFRMALLPASGFQSAQYRLIEIQSTDFRNLVSKEMRNQLPEDASFEEMSKFLYWKTGSIEMASGKKTLTLRQFEEKYQKQFISTANLYKEKNLLKSFENLSKSQNCTSLQDEMKLYDVNVNIKWPLSHYKSAVRYLQKDPDVISATGGTNWQKYLPPRFQKRVFFPSIWKDEELENWGKTGN